MSFDFYTKVVSMHCNDSALTFWQRAPPHLYNIPARRRRRFFPQHVAPYAPTWHSVLCSESALE